VTIWLDAHLPPQIAPWMAATFGLQVVPVRDLGLRDAEDEAIFAAARAAGVVLLTKDRDFPEMVRQLGVPPHVIWLTCGNTSNARLREVLAAALPDALLLVGQGESLVEIGDLPG
jgi:predicted nuclease of predicted toxin-antitoxin system